MTKKNKRRSSTPSNGDSDNKKKRTRQPAVSPEVKEAPSETLTRELAETTAEQFKRELRVSHNTTLFQSNLFASRFQAALRIAVECKHELDNSRLLVGDVTRTNPLAEWAVRNDASGLIKTEDDFSECEKAFAVFMKTGANQWLLADQWLLAPYAEDSAYDENGRDGDGSCVYSVHLGCDATTRVVLTYVLMHAEWALPQLFAFGGGSLLYCVTSSFWARPDLFARLLAYASPEALDWAEPTKGRTALALACQLWEDEGGDGSIVGQLLGMIPFVDPHRVNQHDLLAPTRDVLLNGCRAYDNYFTAWLPRAIREVLTNQTKEEASPIPLLSELVAIVIGYLTPASLAKDDVHVDLSPSRTSASARRTGNGVRVPE